MSSDATKVLLCYQEVGPNQFRVRADPTMTMFAVTSNGFDDGKG